MAELNADQSWAGVLTRWERNGRHGWMIDHENGYQTSIIPCGSDKLGKFELAVRNNGYLVYDTPITRNVLTFLSEEEACEVARRVSELPKRRRGPTKPQIPVI